MLIESVKDIGVLVHQHAHSTNCLPVRLLDCRFEFIRRLTVHELYRLAAARKIVAKTDKHGNLENVRLRPGVSAKTASRLLSPMQVGACRQITKRRQGNGNKLWVEHFDRSEGGLVGTRTVTCFPFAFLNRRYAVGEIERPVGQTA